MMPQMTSTSVLSNFVDIKLSQTAIQVYVCSYQLLEEKDKDGNDLPLSHTSILDEKGDRKMELQETFLRKLKTPSNENEMNSAVCTGQHIFSSANLFEEDIREETITTAFIIGHGKHKQLIKCRVLLSVRKTPDSINLASEPNLMILNNVVQQAFAAKFPCKVGPKLLSLSDMDNYPSDGVSCVRGVIPRVTKVKVKGEMKIVLQLSPALRVLSTKTAFDVAESFPSLRSNPQAWSKFEAALITKKVVTNYGNNGGAVYRVVGVPRELTIDSTFSRKGVMVSFRDYYKEKHNISLVDGQPLIKVKECSVSRSSRPVILPTQVARLMHLEDSQLTILPKICSIYPEERMKRIHSALEAVRSSQVARDILNRFGIEIGKEPIAVAGTVLPGVKVSIQGGKAVNTWTPQYANDMGFAKELGSIRFPPKGEKRTFTLLNFYADRQRNRKSIADSVKTWFSTSQSNVSFEVKDISLDLTRIPQCLENATADRDPNTTVAIVHLLRKETSAYRDVKETLLQRGIVSQVVAKDLKDNSIQMMIQQQIGAKLGNLNWTSELHTQCPNLASNGIVIVGVDTANTMKDISGESTTTRTPTFVVSLVAFHYHHTTGWSHFCNHAVFTGRRQTFGIADSETGTSATSVVDEHYDVATSVSSALGPFLEAMDSHFSSKNLHYGTLICARGSESDGEISKAYRHEPETIANFCESKGKLGVLLAAQRGSKTRFFFKPSPTSRVKQLVNAPRGFFTTDAVPLCGEENEDIGEAGGFYVVGARCNLGHAKATKYNVIFETSPVDKEELGSLFYSLCFLFPNKADGLPYPLPLKAANRYANLFVLLSLQNIKTLSAPLQPTLHYL